MQFTKFMDAIIPNLSNCLSALRSEISRSHRSVSLKHYLSLHIFAGEHLLCEKLRSEHGRRWRCARGDRTYCWPGPQKPASKIDHSVLCTVVRAAQEFTGALCMARSGAVA
jgi:hypothetical protein